MFVSLAVKNLARFLLLGSLFSIKLRGVVISIKFTIAFECLSSQK